MKLLLVRHGQSTNNILQARLDPMVARGEITPEERDRLWMAQRVDDPPLTDTGCDEAQKLGEYYAQWLQQRGLGAKLYASAMVRAAQTIEPLSKLLATPVQFRPDTFEIGGIYSKGTDGERITGKTNTAAELQARFPKYDVRALPTEGMWYTQGFETRPQATVRAAKVAGWLQSAELHSEVGGDVAVMVMHADFLNSLLQQLLGCSHSFYFMNTSTAYLEIADDGHVTVYWMVRVDHLISKL